MRFSLDIKKFAEKVEQNINDVRRGVALDIFSNIVMRTPVGDPKYWKSEYKPKGYIGGTLRGNWQISINVVNSTRLTAPDKSGNRTIAEGSRHINAATGDNTIWIFNNMPYAVRVENGWSTRQAPAGMVKVTLTEFQRAIDEQIRQLS